MICSVNQCASRTIVASDLFLWKESHPLVPLIPLKKPNERPIVLVSRPSYVSITPVEKLSFQWEVSELVAAKKNIIGVYLAMWWALQNVFKLNLKQLNALALSVMIPNIFRGSQFIKLDNMTDSDIELCVSQDGVTDFTHTLKAQKRDDKIEKKKFKKYRTPLYSTTVFIKATNGKYKTETLNPQDFTGYNRLRFYIVKEKFYVERIP